MDKTNRILAFIVMAIAAVTIYAWLFAQDNLINSKIFMMTFNTSLCLMMVSLLYLFPIKNSKIYDVLYSSVAVITVAISSIVLLEYIIGLPFNIDQIFVTAKAHTEFKNPGRMSSLTATGLFMMGLAMALITNVKSIKIYYAIYLLILTILIMGVFGILQNQIWGLALDKYNLNRMSYQSSFCFISMSIILGTHWYSIRDQAQYVFNDINIGNLVKLSIIYFSFVVVISMFLLTINNG